MAETNQFLDARQAELLQLQREYRHMELNRRAYSEETQALLRKQQQNIDKLRKDNDTLRNDIAVLMRGTSKPLSLGQQEEIQKLHEQIQKYVYAIDTEKNNIQVMEEQVDIMKQKILHQRRNMGGVNSTRDNQYMIEKQIKILENRLEKALIKFNEAVAQNKTYRDKIDDLRRERVVFENIYRKMEKELYEKKKKMAEIIEVSNQSYEQRDTYQMEISAIEQANRKEQEDFEEQMVELSRLLDTELALPPPNRIKNTLKSKSTTDINRNDTSKLNSSMMSSSTTNLDQSVVIVDTIGTIERVQNFEEAFNKIKESTGISDVDDLVNIFIKNEDHNFSLFNYVNEQNNEIEKVEEQIQMLREEEQKFTQESGEDAQQHKQILKELENKLALTESMAEKYENRCQDLQRTIEGLKQSIQSLIEKIDIKEENVSDITITESNMLNYLSLIEQYSNSYIEEYAEMKKYLSSNTIAVSNVDSMISLLGTGPKSKMQQDYIHVNPPKLDDYNSDDDDDDGDEETRPLTLEELKMKTLNRLQKKGQGIVKTNKRRKNSGPKK
uniref:ODAD1 central coiled coil region domain-containing protein n=1 Tax=Chromulina nebulosa TaxID=96789 RepID=A0A7S0XDM7_9STRA|mmetsp:Transcript_3645/g.3245  ORF Transcript_3645/g.3245 Transcript_3645/m.3245 type:complete len:555 (+) Transcript_3645:24-1688(+)